MPASSGSSSRTWCSATRRARPRPFPSFELTPAGEASFGLLDDTQFEAPLRVMNLLRLFRKQDGTALVVVMGVLAVLTISGTTMMAYTSQNTKTASRSKVDEHSFSLSEAALNNAMAVLSNPTNNALDPDLLPATEATASAAVYENGTAKWYGVLDRNTAVWTVTGLGLYNNPSGSAQVRRKLT